MLELPSWNLLTRTNKKYTHLSLRLTILWGIGCIIRYFILWPTRIIVTIISVLFLIICTGLIGCLPDSDFKRTIYCNASLVCFRIISRAFSGIITFHDLHNMAKPGGITVANHTSPIVCLSACVCVCMCMFSFIHLKFFPYLLLGCSRISMR